MKTYKALQDKFKRTNMSVKEWYNNSGFPKSEETVNRIINRNLPADPHTLAYLAHCLGFSRDEILPLLMQYAKEDPAKAPESLLLHKLISPSNICDEEKTLIERWRKLNAQKRKLVSDLLKTLEG